jgi:NADH:ubiquinone oxidoreductase subunit F (NADH-binding)
LEHSGHIDPASIEEYIADNGFRALAKVLSGLSPEDVNQIVSE